MKLHRPVFLSIGWAVGAYVIIFLFHYTFYVRQVASFSFLSVLLFTFGMAYTQFFEYIWHKFPMHARLSFFNWALKSHLIHHEIFNGENFNSRKREDLEHITTKWFVFPILLLVHYTVFMFFSQRYALVFFAGVTLHFSVYELCHWCSHVKDNSLDKIVFYLPFLSVMRSYQIRHHQLHHEEPIINFNFTPPYVGDIVFKTKKTAL